MAVSLCATPTITPIIGIGISSVAIYKQRGRRDRVTSHPGKAKRASAEANAPLG
jgi:hypothetical protein